MEAEGALSAKARARFGGLTALRGTGYWKLVDLLADLLRYLSIALLAFFILAIAVNFVNNSDTILSGFRSSPYTGVKLFLVLAVQPSMTILVGAVLAYAFHKIAAVERDRALNQLMQQLYGELTLYGRVSIKYLLNKYGLGDVADLAGILERMSKEMKLRVQIDPTGDEVYVQ